MGQITTALLPKPTMAGSVPQLCILFPAHTVPRDQERELPKVPRPRSLVTSGRARNRCGKKKHPRFGHSKRATSPLRSPRDFCPSAPLRIADTHAQILEATVLRFTQTTPKRHRNPVVYSGRGNTPVTTEHSLHVSQESLDGHQTC